MRRFCVGIWRCLYRQIYKRKHVRIARGALFNKTTVLEEFVKISADSNVNGAKLGSYTYVGPNCNLNGALLGKFCSIASNVNVISATHPSSKFVSTSPVFYSLLKQCGTTFTDVQKFNEHLNVGAYSIRIGNDVWIGQNVLLVGGIVIGDGAIIAAGAVVTKNVPPYAIVGGVPAKLIRYRFSAKHIQALQDNQWWDRSIDWIKQNINLFYDVEVFLKDLGR